MLIIEYADDGTLREYLSKNFEDMDWDVKLTFAKQIASGICCLNDYKYTRDERSDIYSMGVLFWEISSGRIPFELNEVNNSSLALAIISGEREIKVDDTPSKYFEIYTGIYI